MERAQGVVYYFQAEGSRMGRTFSGVRPCLLAEQGSVRDLKGEQNHNREGTWAPTGPAAGRPNSNVCIRL